jgi:predicted ATPase
LSNAPAGQIRNLKLDEHNLNQIIRICQLVEGMPLAIELAAPWLRVMSCEEIANELEKGLDILTTSMRNLPERHRSVRLVFDQSWQSLTPAEQAVLARCRCFKTAAPAKPLKMSLKQGQPG